MIFPFSNRMILLLARMVRDHWQMKIDWIDDIPIFKSDDSTASKDDKGSSAEEDRPDGEDQGELRSVGDLEGEAGDNVAEEGSKEVGRTEEMEGSGMCTRGANTEPEHYWNLTGKPCQGQKANLMLGVEETLFVLSSALETAPYTIQQVLLGPNATAWKEAWKYELDQLQSIGTWEIIPRPHDKPVIPC
jgi:hypothetical protein